MEAGWEQLQLTNDKVMMAWIESLAIVTWCRFLNLQ